MLTKHWFLIALATCFITGYAAAERLDPWVENASVRGGLMFAVMWAMGITLPAGRIRDSLAKPFPVGLAIGLNMLLVPALAVATAFWLTESQFAGLFVAAVVPCTLAGASVWTRKAGGDETIAMMTTVVTNLACILVVPFWTWRVLSEWVEVQAIDQAGKLVVLVVVPLALAQAMRRFGFRRWADRRKSAISAGAQVGVLLMVLIGSASSGLRSGGSAQDGPSGTWAAFLCLLATTLGVHLLALFVGVLLGKLARLDRGQQIAVGIAGSQKTLMVGLQITIDLGVSVVPMLIFHVGQLSLDTLVAHWWRGRNTEGT